MNWHALGIAIVAWAFGWLVGYRKGASDGFCEAEHLVRLNLGWLKGDTR